MYINYSLKGLCTLGTKLENFNELLKKQSNNEVSFTKKDPRI